MGYAVPETDHLLYRPLWQRSDPLQAYSKRLDWKAVLDHRAVTVPSLFTSHWSDCRELCDRLSSELLGLTTEVSVSDDEVIKCIAKGSELSTLVKLVARLIPWRNGPFQFESEFVDAEWRTDLKWKRILKYLPDLKSRKIVDVGCNNGYILARLLELEPALLVGLDPSERCFFQFELIQAFLKHSTLHYELGRSNLLAAFPNFFDFMLCQGVIYHRKDPINFLGELHVGLRKNGFLLLESMCINQAASSALCVAGRYAKMHNVYFIPTPKTLFTWLDIAGFEPLQVFALNKTTASEQRQTDYAPYQSLSDFLNPDNLNLTVEGYPAPWRVSILARKC